MERYYAFLSRLFVIVGLASLILAVIAKITAFVVWGLYPLSYLRFAGICFLFVIALSLCQIAVKKK